MPCCAQYFQSLDDVQQLLGLKTVCRSQPLPISKEVSGRTARFDVLAAIHMLQLLLQGQYAEHGRSSTGSRTSKTADWIDTPTSTGWHRIEADTARSAEHCTGVLTSLLSCWQGPILEA